jgi:hypothetical protein
MDYVAVFVISFIAMVLLTAVFVPQDQIKKHPQVIRITAWAIPTMVTALYWAIRQLLGA